MIMAILFSLKYTRNPLECSFGGKKNVLLSKIQTLIIISLTSASGSAFASAFVSSTSIVAGASAKNRGSLTFPGVPMLLHR